MIDISAVYGDSNRVNVLSESNTTRETENVTNAKDKWKLTLNCYSSYTGRLYMGGVAHRVARLKAVSRWFEPHQKPLLFPSARNNTIVA